MQIWAGRQNGQTKTIEFKLILEENPRQIFNVAFLDKFVKGFFAQVQPGV
jgi:hypothetical protein